MNIANMLPNMREWGAIDYFRAGTVIFAPIGIIFGLTAQAIENYQIGETHMPWMLNGPLMIASFCRAMLFLLKREYQLMAIDLYGFAISAILFSQTFGFFLR